MTAYSEYVDYICKENGKYETSLKQITIGWEGDWENNTTCVYVPPLYITGIAQRGPDPRETIRKVGEKRGPACQPVQTHW